MAIAAISITPIGEGPSVGRYVAAAVSALERYPDLTYETGPMFTTVEGHPDQIVAAVRAMQEAVFAAGAVRVSTVLKLDDRRDRAATMASKVASVRRHFDPGETKD